jgi:hypothetical protein
LLNPGEEDNISEKVIWLEKCEKGGKRRMGEVLGITHCVEIEGKR